MESMVSTSFWSGKKVFLTGHTGFKGSWLAFVLNMLGAEVFGYALKPNTSPNLFELLKLGDNLHGHVIGDVRNLELLCSAVEKVSPDIIFHLAAQPLVRYSYLHPAETYETNVMGTVNILEAFRFSVSARVLVNVTTDKCYKNREWCWSYRENDRLGGHDPYSNSKACSELVTSAYRDSYFNTLTYNEHKKTVATARAGNVIGGGDWNQDRLIPDLVKAFLKQEKISIRNPNSVRPWQHVLESISAYLMLAESLWSDPIGFSGAWNFGPYEEDCLTVSEIAKVLSHKLGKALLDIPSSEKQAVHEASLLKLDISKAVSRLSWRPTWQVGEALDRIAEWYSAWHHGKDVSKMTRMQVNDFFNFN